MKTNHSLFPVIPSDTTKSNFCLQSVYFFYNLSILTRIIFNKFLCQYGTIQKQRHLWQDMQQQMKCTVSNLTVFFLIADKITDNRLFHLTSKNKLTKKYFCPQSQKPSTCCQTIKYFYILIFLCFSRNNYKGKTTPYCKMLQ